jgi:hypothetical protein
MDWDYAPRDRRYVQAVCTGCAWTSVPLRPEHEDTWATAYAAFSTHLGRPPS